MKHSVLFRKLSMVLLSMVLIFSLVTGCSASFGSGKTNDQTQPVVSTETSGQFKETEQSEAARAADGQNHTGKTKTPEKDEPDPDDEPEISEDGEYTSKEDVATYLYLYGHLPDNYITKKEAKELGWVSNKGNLWDVAPGMSIGGDSFGNREGLLPDKKGRKYFECDIDYDGGYRGSDRIIYSNDGLVYFTGDHYQSYELLYGEED